MKDILNIVEYLSNDRLIKKDKILDMIESIIKFSIKKKFKDNNIKVIFDRNLCLFKVFRIIKNDNILNEFKNKNNNLNINNKSNLNFLEEEIKNIKFNRSIIQYAKNFIFKKINNLEKIELFNKYKKFIYKVFICTIKKIYSDRMLLLIDNSIEGIILNRDLLYNDNFKINNKFKGILYFIKNVKSRIQLFISRKNLTIIKELLKNEIIEVNNNIIEIMSISREPGVKTKIAVKSNDKNINPIYFFVVNKKSILKSISYEFNNELIDIVLWNSNLLEFVKNSVYPINIKSVFFNKKNKNINILINKNDIVRIIGKNGVNIKLISSLINYNVNISYNKD